MAETWILNRELVASAADGWKLGTTPFSITGAVAGGVWFQKISIRAANVGAFVRISGVIEGNAVQLHQYTTGWTDEKYRALVLPDSIDNIAAMSKGDKLMAKDFLKHNAVKASACTAKAIINGETIIDLTGDTVTADKMVSGVTAHDNSGKQITGTYVPLDTSDATATENDIARGATAYVNGKKVTGTLDQYQEIENTAYWLQQGNGGTLGKNENGMYVEYTFPSVYGPGVFPASVKSTIYFNNLQLGTVYPTNVLKGETFSSVVGIAQTGTMPNNGAAAIRLSDLTAKSVTAGYYSGGTAKIADAEAAKIIPGNIKKGVTILGVEGTMEASASGDYNIAATTNADGTQNLAITDAAGGGGSGQQLVNLTITVDPTNAPEDWNWSLFIYSSHGDSIELNADNLVSAIPGCIVGGIFAIDATASVDLKAVKGYLDRDTITPSCVNCFFDIIGNAGGFISSNDRYPAYLCQIDPGAPAGAEATMTLKFN